MCLKNKDKNKYSGYISLQEAFINVLSLTQHMWKQSHVLDPSSECWSCDKQIQSLTH